MSFRVVTLVGLVSIAWSMVPGHAQSLADVARKEQDRRKAIKTAGKVYTNGDLKPAPPAPPSDSSSPEKAGGEGGQSTTAKDKDATAAKDEKSADEGAKKAGDEKAVVKDQAYWHGRMKSAQETLDRDQVYADALQSRIAALTSDFVNRDDPVQRAVIGVDRDKAIAELERLKKTIVDDKQAVSDLEEEARRSGVPPGWLR